MGRWSAAHWKTATFGWLAFVVVAFALGGMVGTKNIDPNTAGPGPVGPHGQDPRRRLQAARRRERPDPEPLACVGEPAFNAAIARRRRPRLEGRGRAERPLEPGTGQISKDGHSALVEFDIRGDKDKAADKIGPVLDSVAAAQRAHPGFFIGEFGDASAPKGVDTAFGNDLARPGCSRSRSR